MDLAAAAILFLLIVVMVLNMLSERRKHLNYAKFYEAELKSEWDKYKLFLEECECRKCGKTHKQGREEVDTEENTLFTGGDAKIKWINEVYCIECYLKDRENDKNR